MNFYKDGIEFAYEKISAKYVFANNQEYFYCGNCFNGRLIYYCNKCGGNQYSYGHNEYSDALVLEICCVACNVAASEWKCSCGKINGVTVYNIVNITERNNNYELIREARLFKDTTKPRINAEVEYENELPLAILKSVVIFIILIFIAKYLGMTKF